MSQQEKATLIDLAEDGMAVQFGKKLPPTSKVYFQFKLPEQSASVRLSGQVIWQDWNGRAGIQFVDVPKVSRRLLTDYLAAHGPSKFRRRGVPDVTVEMEEPLQVMHGAMRRIAGRRECASKERPKLASRDRDCGRVRSRQPARHRPLRLPFGRGGLPHRNSRCRTIAA